MNIYPNLEQFIDDVNTNTNLYAALTDYKLLVFESVRSAHSIYQIIWDENHNNPKPVLNYHAFGDTSFTDARYLFNRIQQLMDEVN